MLCNPAVGEQARRVGAVRSFRIFNENPLVENILVACHCET